MTVNSTGTGGERLAGHFLRMQQTFPGITQKNCLEMMEGLDEGQCGLIETASKVVVDEPLRARLVSAGFAKRFIDGFAGADGMAALKARASFFLSLPNPDNQIIDNLGSLGPGAEAAIPMLMTKAREKNISAIQALGKIGPKAKGAIPMLMELAKNTAKGWDPAEGPTPERPSQLAQAAIEALGLICQPPAIPSDGKLFPEVRELITKIYNEHKTDARASCVNALCNLGPIENSYDLHRLVYNYITGNQFKIPDNIGRMGNLLTRWLLEELKGPNDEPKNERIIKALGFIGGPAIDILLRIVFNNQLSEEFQESIAGCKALLKLHPEMEEELTTPLFGHGDDSVLSFNCELDQNPVVRKRAVEIIKQIDFKDPSIFKKLTNIYKNRQLTPGIRARAIATLGYFLADYERAKGWDLISDAFADILEISKNKTSPWETRSAAIQTLTNYLDEYLGTYGTASWDYIHSEVIPSIIAAAKDKEKIIRNTAQILLPKWASFWTKISEGGNKTAREAGQDLLSALLSIEDSGTLPNRIKAIAEMNISVPDGHQTTLSKILLSADDVSKISIINIFKLNPSGKFSAVVVDAVGHCLNANNTGVSQAAYDALSRFTGKDPNLVFNTLFGIATKFSPGARTIFARLCRENATNAHPTKNYWQRIAADNSNPPAQKEAIEVLKEIEKKQA